MASIETKYSLNTFSGGMNLDSDISSIRKDQYRYAENARLSAGDSSTLGAISPVNKPLKIDLNFNGVSVVKSSSIRDIGIIFANSESDGIIYRIHYSDSSISGKKEIFRSKHKFSSLISVVPNYESNDNIRVYFSEKDMPIRVINVSSYADQYNLSISGNIDKLNCIGTSLLDKPIVAFIGSGSLSSGKIQYAYSLYSKYGSQTSISPMSDQVNLFASSIGDKSSDIIGSDQGDLDGNPSGKSVSIKVEIPEDGNYTNIEIFSIHYSSSSSEPTVRLIADIPISGSLIRFTDGGSTYIGEMSISEFNSIGAFKLSAELIESKDNILFAANSTEIINKFDDYDVRAYSFNASGNSRLYSRDGSYIDINQNNSSINYVDPKHDCINLDIYTKEKFSDIEFKYRIKNPYGHMYGGKGPNVAYSFTNLYLIESYGNMHGLDHNSTPSGAMKYIDDRSPRIGDVIRDVNSFRVFSSDGTIETIDSNVVGIHHHRGYLNYADPIIASSLASYQRDEIYRFGAVLYDKNGNKSDVKWIADIRFPAGYIKSTTPGSSNVWISSHFESPDEVVSPAHDGIVSGANLKAQELLVKSMGLKFEFSNMPESIVKIEIVRSKRDLINRTIYAQGVIQKTGTKFIEFIDTPEGREMPTGLNGSIRPHQLIAMGYSYSVVAPLGGWKNYGEADYQPMGMYAYSDLGRKYGGEINGVSGRNNYNYTDHSLAPYHANKNFYLFINPETSFYGKQYVDQLKSISSNMKAVVSDVIWPKSTPPLFRETSASDYSVYFGNSIARKSVDLISAKKRLTTMHFAADITESIYSRYNGASASTSPFMTVGLVGLAKAALVFPSAPEQMQNTVPYSPGSGSYTIADRTDIRNTDMTPYLEPTIRAYVSLGKVIFQHDKYDSGSVDSSDATMKYSNGYQLNDDLPLAKDDKANELGIGSGTFKYYYNFNKINSPLESYGGQSIAMIYQNGNGVMSSSSAITISSLDQIKTFSISSMEYSGSIEHGIGIESANSSYISIANKQYLNWSKSIQRGDSAAAHGLTNNANKGRLSGIHGDGIVLYMNDDNVFPSISVIDSVKRRHSEPSFVDNKEIEIHGSSALSTLICNMKNMTQSIYGGNSYEDRSYTEYVPTGYILSADSNRNAVGYVFGGDTYVGIFDYTIVRSTDPMPNSDLYDHASVVDTQYCQTGSIGAMIPLESSINMRVQSGKSMITDSNPFIQSSPGVYGPGISAGMTFSRTQTLPEFKYNSAYSADQYARVYLTLISDSDLASRDYRVYASDKKYNNESRDSWSVFRPANYIDVDSRHGSITRMKSYSNRLFFWQENAIGVLSVNDRSLIKDNNQAELVLGSGDVLSRYDYISTSNGLHKGAINALTVSPVGIYWYDHKNAEICLYSSQAGSLSKIKGVQSVLNRNAKMVGMNIPMAYNKKYNEVLTTLSDTIISV